ncbi:conserved protein of unknown function [Pseudomonas sp. JV551A1]|uniref:Uncharacterized protein n=2 Tax=Pseudomonas TaxID=286 RepID=A0AAQ1PCS3_9PSED|nr:conserved protein of unknown function [Pseudomonas sp. JV551A1]SPO62780.1 conserved protein of unknown function [Pseudomonas inefficax]
MKKGAAPTQAYLTMFTTKPVDGLQDVADKTFPSLMNVMDQALSVSKLDTIADTIERQRPHDLSKFFGKGKVNRWTVLNKPLLIKREASDDLDW